MTCHFLRVIFQPVSQWSIANVIKWMAAVNLHRYAEVFKVHTINGMQLLHLDDTKLRVSDVLEDCAYFNKTLCRALPKVAQLVHLTFYH